MNDQEHYQAQNPEQQTNAYQSQYNRQYDQTYYQRPQKKRIGAGGIIAIILVSCFALLMVAGAVIAGKMLFDPDSRFSLYKSIGREEVQEGEKETENPRQQFEDPFEDKDDDENAFGGDHGQNTSPLNPQIGGSTPDIDTSHASESMDDVVVGSEKKVLTTSEIYAKAAPSVVGIVVSTQNGEGSGSGIIMTSDGYIMTNAHVVEDALTVTVTLLDGSEYPAVVVGSDEATDVAVIRIDKTGLAQAVFGDSDQITVGEDAIAIGNPLGLELSFTITKGIVSAINRNITVSNYNMTLIQTDAAINPGNSGGPLINQYGEVIGITSAKIMASYSVSNVEGIGFAIPINAAMKIARDLAANGHVTGRPYLGITIQTQYVQIENRYEYHVVVITVEENSPASKAGLQPGDVILAFNGAEVEENSDLLAERDKYKPGDTVKLTILRNGGQMELTLTMTEAQ